MSKNIIFYKNINYLFKTHYSWLSTLIKYPSPTELLCKT